MDKAQSLMELFKWLKADPNGKEKAPELLERFKYIAGQFPDTVVARAVQDFCEARVQGQNTEWLPSPTSFAAQCHKRNELNVWREERARLNSESNADRALTYQPPQETPEQRQAAYERCMAKLNLPGEQDEFEQRVKAQSEDYVPDDGIKADYNSLPHPHDKRPLAQRLKIGAGGNYATQNTKSAPEFQQAGDLAKEYVQ